MITYENGWPVQKLSRLYKIEPQGLGTPLVESLSGYIARLAMAHLVSVSNLTTYVKSMYQPELRIIPNSKLVISEKTRSTMNGCSSSAETWVAALEQLTTRDDLRRLTLLPFAHLFSDKETINTIRRWCPSCLDEWLNKKLTLYEPLLWCIKSVDICPLHHEELMFKCPHCGHMSTLLRPRTIPGYCSICEGWVGQTTSNSQSPEHSEFQIWAAEETGELLASGKIENITQRGTLPAALDYYIKKRSKRDGIQFTAKLIKVSPKTLLKWQSGESQPSLHNLLRLCWLFKLKLVELDTQAVNIENIEGFDERVAEESSENSLSRSKFDWMKVEKHLNDIVEGNVEPMRISDIAKVYGCCPAHIYPRYSDLCKTVTAKCAQYKLEWKSWNKT